MKLKLEKRSTKKMKRFNKTTSKLDLGLITSTVLTGENIFTIFASGVELFVGTSLLLSLATAITQKPFKVFTINQGKHDVIKLLVESKLDSIADIILQV